MKSPENALSIEQLLSDVSARADTGDFAEALAILEIAHSGDPGNIYIAALKRQLESLFTLDARNSLSNEKRRELVDPMPGIIECALRDFGRPRPSATQPPAAHPAPRASEPAAPHPPAEDMASKELEALKLLYFQRASKFVMHGEYEQALAEVQRVFVVDPNNMIAKEYAQRVENLLQHARKLASEPIDEQTDTGQYPASEAHGSAGPEENSPGRNERATAWDDEFLSPAAATPRIQHPGASPAQKQTVAYGDSLAAALEPGDESSDTAPRRRRSRVSRVLIVAIALLLVGGGMFVILSSMTAGTGDPGGQAVVHTPAANPNVQATATVVSQRDQAAEHIQAPAVEARQVAAPVQEPVKSPALAEQKPKSDPPPAASEPPKEKAASQDAPAVPLPDQPAVAEPTPAQVDPPAESPAFVAVEKDPQIVNLVKPQFPGFVWKSAGEGQVVIKVLIDTEGKPIDTQVLKSSNVVFEEGVKEAVMKSQFAPAQMGRGPVTAWLTIPFRFKQPR